MKKIKSCMSKISSLFTKFNNILNDDVLLRKFITIIFMGGCLVCALDNTLNELLPEMYSYFDINFFIKTITIRYTRCLSSLLFIIIFIYAVEIFNVVSPTILRILSLLFNGVLFMFVRKGIKASVSKSVSTGKFLNVSIERVMSEKEMFSTVEEVEKHFLHPKYDELTVVDFNAIKEESYTTHNNICKEKLIANAEKYITFLNEYNNFLEQNKIWFHFFNYTVTDDTFINLGNSILTFGFSLLVTTLIKYSISQFQSQVSTNSFTNSNNKNVNDINREINFINARHDCLYSTTQDNISELRKADEKNYSELDNRISDVIRFMLLDPSSPECDEYVKKFIDDLTFREKEESMKQFMSTFGKKSYTDNDTGVTKA